jgi:hypothetical protein
MKLLIAALGASLIIISGLGVHLALSSSASTCQPVLVLAVGGCDAEGVCGVMVGNQQNQIKKSKLSYPIAGVVDELCE